MSRPLSLSEFNALVREVIELSLPEARWITAEVSELRVAQNGHCYLELVEKDERSRGLRAKASAHVWRSAWPLLRAHFEEETGQRLAAGMKVLVQVEATFHELYGYSLNITDIDPTYTMGDLARRRQEILRQLEADGVLTLNKELTLPRLLSRIAVVSSPSAAGYGDFLRQLEDSPFRFDVRLFPAIMQGEGVEDSIIAALEAVDAASAATPEGEEGGGQAFSCVVILRGGGAVSDLQGFESYALAANVAQFPLPVLTGIGHERDDTVIDLVAHTRLKTPTAVAAFLIDHQRAALQQLEAVETGIADTAMLTLRRESQRFDTLSRRLQLFSTQYCSLWRERLMRLAARIEVTLRSRLQHQHHLLDRHAEALPRLAHQRLERERQRLSTLERALDMASPDRILRLGYSLTLKGGHVVTSTEQLSPGDLIETHLASGTIRSRITETLPCEE